MRDSALGRKLTEEAKQKLRECNMGDKYPFYGKTHTEEQRKKIGAANGTKM
jgi:hypothetical protein